MYEVVHVAIEHLWQQWTKSLFTVFMN